MNKIVNILLRSLFGLVIVASGFFGMKYLASQKQELPKKPEVVIRKTVETRPVTNGAIPTTLEIQGRLQAFNKIAIFCEVGGLLNETSRPFKVGTYFPKGATMLEIDDTETRLSLQAQKATLLNAIAMMMPDIKIDYADNLPRWQAYLDAFSLDQPLRELPEPSTQAEKLFVAGRNLYTQYYNIKSVEERLSRFKVVAPFSGVLTQANIDRGAVVRTGQQVGELMATGDYELVATVPLSQLSYLKIGGRVVLKSEDIGGNWSGIIKRISDQIDPTSQTVQVFVRVNGEELKEGMFLRGEAQATTLTDVVELDRNLLMDQKAVYILEQDSVLRLQAVEVLKFNRETVVVSGLADGTRLVTNTIAGAFDGMLVKHQNTTSPTPTQPAAANQGTK